MQRMNSPAPVLYTVDQGVAHIELNRPESFNSLTTPLAHALREAAARGGADDDVRVVLLSGRGRAFCAGGDVKMMANADDPAGAVRELAHAAHDSVKVLAGIDKPVIAVVHGSVAGGGLGLSCAADVVLAGESTKFVTAYAGIAVTPDCSLTWALPKIVGERRALEMLLLNKPLSAETAENWGLVNAVHPDDEVLGAGLALARRIAEGPSAAALGRTRRLVRDSAERTLPEQLDVEADSIAEHVTSPEAQSLIAAFAGR